MAPQELRKLPPEPAEQRQEDEDSCDEGGGGVSPRELNQRDQARQSSKDGADDLNELGPSDALRDVHAGTSRRRQILF
jgi:hypothetical protein